MGDPPCRRSRQGRKGPSAARQQSWRNWHKRVFRVPNGFCITAAAYEHFLKEGNLVNVIRMELGRKPFEAMRWEEIWDAALRIRSAFLATPIPPAVAQEVGMAVAKLGADKVVAVRSSAPGEDSANRSFAGLHESFVGPVGEEAVLDAVRLVWASLWSDAALLYRHELSLDPSQSRMAVLVQEVITEDRSGVAFGRDPRRRPGRPDDCGSCARTLQRSR